MPVKAPFNDGQCLGQLHSTAAEFRKTEQAQQLAAEVGTIDRLIDRIAGRAFLPDTGDPSDGPRVQCDVSQRVDLTADAGSCFEDTALFLAIAPLLDPDRIFSSATVSIDGALHTYPAEFVDGYYRPIDFGKVGPLSPNIMAAGLMKIRNGTPLGRHALVPWFDDLGRNACTYYGVPECYPASRRALQRWIMRGHRSRYDPELECMLDLAARDAQLFGPLGPVAFDRMHSSIRNLGVAIDTQAIGKLLDGLVNRAEPMAGDVIKAILIAKFGPAAELALNGADVDLFKSKGKGKPPGKKTNAKESSQTTEARLQRMRRFTPGYSKNRQSTAGKLLTIARKSFSWKPSQTTEARLQRMRRLTLLRKHTTT